MSGCTGRFVKSVQGSYMGSKKDEMTVSNEVMLNAAKALRENAGKIIVVLINTTYICGRNYCSNRRYDVS